VAETIWKFDLREVRNRVMIPRGATFLNVAEQHGKIMVWARVDTAQPEEVRDIYLVGTGTEVPEDAGRHIGTALCAHGSLVFHAFERAGGENGGS